MPALSLAQLGWKSFFERQLDPAEERDCLPARVAAVHKSHLSLLSEEGELPLPTALFSRLGPCAVGDWVLLDPPRQRPLRRLERFSLLQRKAPGEKVEIQLMAANVDLLLVVSSCNQEFKAARLERYLALAYEAGILPVVVLTKADLAEDAKTYRREAQRLRAGLVVETVNALDPQTLDGLLAICGAGQTLVMAGSSGVGKSTLAGSLGVAGLDTGPIRERDSSGRHTTTSRSLHLLDGGAILIDSPGIRELQIPSCEQGLELLFEDIREAGPCRFVDCGHTGEPGCAVLEAVRRGRLDERRVQSYLKLLREQRYNSETLAEKHERVRKQGKLYKSIQRQRRKERDPWQ